MSFKKDGRWPVAAIIETSVVEKFFWGKGVINAIYANSVGAAKAVFGWRTTCRDEKRALGIPVCR